MSGRVARVARWAAAAGGIALLFLLAGWSLERAGAINAWLTTRIADQLGQLIGQVREPSAQPIEIGGAAAIRHQRCEPVRLCPGFSVVSKKRLRIVVVAHLASDRRNAVEEERHHRTHTFDVLRHQVEKALLRHDGELGIEIELLLSERLVAKSA